MTDHAAPVTSTVTPRRATAASQRRWQRGKAALYVVALVSALTIVPLFAAPYTLVVLTQILLYATVAVSLQLLWGRGGQLSFGQAAFFGMGAFTYAILSVRGDAVGLTALVLAAVVPATVGLIFGYFLFFGGVRGAYFSVVTLAFAIVANQVAVSWSSVTGGNAGLTGVPGLTMQVGATSLDMTSLEGSYYLGLAILSVALLVALAVHFSNVGLVLRAIRENEMRATFCGFQTSGYLTLLLTISAGLAGLAGGGFAAVSNYAAPDMLGTLLSIEMLTWVAIGGRNYVVGALVGVVVVRWLNLEISTVLPTSWPLIVGIFFVVVVLILPQGIIGLLHDLKDRVLRLRRSVCRQGS